MRRLLFALLPASALAVTATLLTQPLLAQAPANGPTFEVASVKRNMMTGNMVMATAGIQPGGRVDMRMLTLRNLMVRAFEVQPYQVIGGPGWVDTDRFDIVAKAEGDPSPAEVNLMLRALLADRFKLAVHTETRELPMYRLVLARRDGSLGSDLQPSTADCSPGARGAAPPPGGQGGPVIRSDGAGLGAGRGGPGGPGAALGGSMGCRTMMGPGRLMMGGQPIAQLAQLLSNQVGRPVVDATGLEGRYDISLTFAPEGRGGGGFGGPRPPDAPPIPTDADTPSLFTALQEQLGLRLESGRAPVEVIVIDHVEPPSED